MRSLIMSLTIVSAVLILSACGGREPVSRDELPLIKQSVVALENGIKAHSAHEIDSLLSSEAADMKLTPQSILDFIYSNGAMTFTGFGNKQIVFRADAARVDCIVLAADSLKRPITLTLKKENGIWRLKNIEADTERAFPIKPDSSDTGGSPE